MITSSEMSVFEKMLSDANAHREIYWSIEKESIYKKFNDSIFERGLREVQNAE